MGRQKGETTRESIYRGGLEQVKVRITSTCTPDPLCLLDVVTKALEEGLSDGDNK